MSARREYRFKIQAYSPETMPMKRLAEYIADLSILFGEEPNVHLIAIEPGSTCPVILIDPESEPKVRDRVRKAQDREGPEEAIRAIEWIDERLARDGASANIIAPDDSKVIEFRGATAPRTVEWPSINQVAELFGIPIAVGGRGDPVPVHLQDGEAVYNLLADRSKAKVIATHLFTSTIRVSGRGRWKRLATGWELERFKIDDFEPVGVVTLEDAMTSLRSVDAQWKKLGNPLDELAEIRRGENSDQNGGIRQ